MKKLKTKRLVIRPYELSDQEAVYEVINDPIIYRTTLNIPYPYPKEQVATWLYFTQKNREYKKGYEWGIFKENQYIGNIGLVNIDHKHHHSELCYFISSNEMGKGYATEAILEVLHYGFNDLALERIVARCMIHNEASKKVMQKCGLLFEGISRHEVLKENQYIDVYQTAIIKEDYINSYRK